MGAGQGCDHTEGERLMANWDTYTPTTWYVSISNFEITVLTKRREQKMPVWSPGLHDECELDQRL